MRGNGHKTSQLDVPVFFKNFTGYCKFLFFVLSYQIIMQLKLTATIPRPLNTAGIKLALIEGMRDIGIEIRENFEDTTRTWNRKPKFDPPTSVPKVGVDTITVETSTSDEIYGWVSDGTKKHAIPTVPGVKRLRFPSEFIAKTSPGIIGSGVGFSGGDLKFPVMVMHPGIEARKFDKEIAEKNKNNFKRILENSIKIARLASGHAYP